MTANPQRATEDRAIDPVCGMTIASSGAPSRTFEGVTYHFCSELCLTRFDRDGIAYVAAARLNLEGWGRTPTPGFLMPPLPANVSRPHDLGTPVGSRTAFAGAPPR